MSALESSAQLLTNLFALSRESDAEAKYLGGAYRCIEVTELNRKVSHSVFSANHGLLGEVRVLMTSGIQKTSDTSDCKSIKPKMVVEEVTLPRTDIPFFMLAIRPQPIESRYPGIFVNPTILVACTQDGLSRRAQPVISSVWEALDVKSGIKIAGDLDTLGFSSRGLFTFQDRTIVNSFIYFTQKVPEWGMTCALGRIHSRLRNMRLEKLSQYDLFAGTPSKVTYPSLPLEVMEATDSSFSDIAS